MDHPETKGTQYWRSCCSGCVVEAALLVGAVTASALAARIIAPQSSLAMLLSIAIYPTIYIIGSIVWSFTLFIVMGLDAFRVSVARQAGKARWLPESTPKRPGASMYLVTGLTTAMLCAIILQAEGDINSSQPMSVAYFAFGGLYGVALWILGRHNIVGPLSPVLQWLIDNG